MSTGADTRVDPRWDGGVIAWFAKNVVAANMVLLTIAAAGVASLLTITAEVFPEMENKLVNVSVVYPGASPEEVEEGICSRIEEEVQGLDGVKRIRSTAAEGVGTVSIEVLQDTDTRRVLDDVKTRVDAIDNFPEEAEEPTITEVVLQKQVINVAVSGDTDETSLKRLGEQVRDEILALPGITKAELAAVRPYEVSIEVSEDALRRYGMTFDEVARAVRASSLDLPGGEVRTEHSEILLRTKGQAYVGEDFEQLVLRTHADGTRILVGDVATVIDGFEETDQVARFDGERAVLVQVFRVGDQSAFDVAAAVKGYVAEASRRVPEGISLTTWRDDSKILASRLELLVDNGAMGFVLVFLVLALFLRLRLAFWVVIGIPVSFLGAIALMPAFGITVNMISLFAFILVLGIVVDDAIVTGENIFSRRDTEPSSLQAAIRGTKEVAVPVTFGVLTTVVAFAPMLDVAGNARQIWMTIPLIVIPTLLFSLVESKIVLPAHLAGIEIESRKRRPHGLGWLLHGIEKLWGWVQMPFLALLDLVIHRVYKPTFELALRWRYASVALGLAGLLLTVGLIGSGRVKFTYFPEVEGDNIVALLTMPQGTPADATRRAVERIEDAALRLEEAFGVGHGELVQHMLASVAEQPYRAEQAMNQGGRMKSFSGAHLGEVNIQLVPAEERRFRASQVLAKWRELAGPIPDAVELDYTSSLFSAGEDIDIQLASPDIGALNAAADALAEHLATFDGVDDIADSFRLGKEEVKLSIRPAAQALGLTLADLATQVRQGFHGEEAQRIQRGRDDVKVMVRYPREGRSSLSDLETARVRTPDGTGVPFPYVAEATFGRSPAAINRTDRARTINVTAKVDEDVTNQNEVLAKLQEPGGFMDELLADHPGLTYSLEGDAREQRETLMSLGINFLIALFVIYALMAIPFRSYVQPLIVLSAVVFGLIGAVLGHLLLGYDLSILSLCGMVALAGVVVNDSLVLVDFVNRGREAGQDLVALVHDAGVRRFRPILLTSMTTFAGLTPLIRETSVQAQFLIPMAVSLAYGVMFATVVTLGLVPCFYLILEDLKAVWAWLFGRPDAAGSAGAAAA